MTTNMVITIIGFILLFIAIIATVIIAKKKSVSVGDYLSGSGGLGGFVSAFTFSASAASAGLFLGGAGMAYTFGWPGAMYQFGSITGIFVSWVVIAPRLRRLSGQYGALSTPTLLTKKYGMPVLKLITAIWMIVFIVPMMVVQFSGAGFMFEAQFGLDYTTSLVLFGLVVAIFTAVGGYFAVAYLDTIQGILMTVGMAILVPLALVSVGGFTGLNHSLAQINPAFVGWTGFMPRTLQIGLTITFLVAFSGQPHLLTRFYSLKDKTASRIAFPLSMFLTGFYMMAGCLVGLVTRVNFPDLATGDLAMPTAIGFFMPVFGIVVWLALLSAIMSTVDSLLLVAGTSLTHDIITGYIKPNMSQKSELLTSKIGVLVICLIAFVIALKPPALITIVNSFAMGAFALILGVPLFVGLYWKKANRATAISATLISPIIYIIWKQFLVQSTSWHEMPATLLITIPLVIIATLAFPNKSMEEPWTKSKENRI